MKTIAALFIVIIANDSFGQHGRGVILPNHRTQSQLNDDVRAYYGVWKQKFLIDAGDGLYRVSFGSTNPGRTVSEGQGYGMMIVAWMAGHDPDEREIFDGLWCSRGSIRAAATRG